MHIIYIINYMYIIYSYTSFFYHFSSILNFKKENKEM